MSELGEQFIGKTDAKYKQLSIYDRREDEAAVINDNQASAKATGARETGVEDSEEETVGANATTVRVDLRLRTPTSYPDPPDSTTGGMRRIISKVGN